MDVIQRLSTKYLDPSGTYFSDPFDTQQYIKTQQYMQHPLMTSYALMHYKKKGI
jgi:hypothetical protein